MIDSTIRAHNLDDNEVESEDIQEEPAGIQAVDVSASDVPGLKAWLIRRIRRGVAVAAGAMLGGSSLVASVSATGVNWTEIQEIVTGAASIFPAFGDMITGVIGPLMTLGIAGMVLYFFDAIVEAFKSAFSFFKRG